MIDSNRSFINDLADLALLIIHGVLLWIVVPLGAVTWVLLSPWLLTRGVAMSKFLAWVDMNFVAMLQRSILRPFFSKPNAWVPKAAMSQVEHRLGGLDFF